MLEIIVGDGVEFWDERTNTFVYVQPQTLRLEHSLVSISKWESKWHKPYLGKQEKSYEEVIDYIKCMTITQNVKDETFLALSDDNLRAINEYISDPMTATVINKKEDKFNSEIVTSELIYYWMIALNIPFECQKWHINRLLMLINVCNVKNTPPKKRSAKEIATSNAALNAARRKALNTTG